MLIRLRRRRARERGFSLIELLIVIAIILIILSIALPKMSQSQRYGREMKAMAEIGTIQKAEVQYYSQFNHYGTLGQLGPPASSGAQEGADAADLIPPGLATGSSGGYNFTVTVTPSGYTVTALPKAFGSTGKRSFYSDESGVIHISDKSDPATASSPTVQ
ncbi:MAG: prepilin-type N-terminal cleavage/methylation domain-containing protein [Acidobacteriaceae bacterium]|nr:prepilin-type N-terminal cleavage/methylation domain-containing protein [Acidobacteriaceae bacterium]